jgi:hypothetical protein
MRRLIVIFGYTDVQLAVLMKNEILMNKMLRSFVIVAVIPPWTQLLIGMNDVRSKNLVHEMI